MATGKYLRIAGTLQKVNALPIKKTITFDGAGKIRASAVKRTSKNRYKVYIILDFWATCIDVGGLREALEELNSFYDEYGCIPDVGEKR